MYHRELIFGFIQLPHSQIIISPLYLIEKMLQTFLIVLGRFVHGLKRLWYNVLKTKCNKVGLAKIKVGPSDMDEQLIPVFMGPNERFGMDEELVHFGVHLSQGLDVFLDPVSTKRAGQNVNRTKGTWTKRQGTTLGMY
jgi:hypothetical protein